MSPETATSIQRQDGHVASVEEHHAALRQLQSVDAGQQIQRPMPIPNSPEIEELNRQREVGAAEVGLPTHLVEVSWTTSGGFMTCAESSAPCGTVHVIDGQSQTFEAIPEPGWELAMIVVDDVSLGKIASYSFTRCNVDHTVRRQHTSLRHR